MTRETKIGLLVSFSFLCLVGIVLYCKLREVDGPPADQVAQSAPAEPVPAGQVPPPPKPEPANKDAIALPAAAHTAAPTAPSRPYAEPEPAALPAPIPTSTAAPAPPATSSEIARPMPQGPPVSGDNAKPETPTRAVENPAPVLTTVPAAPGPSSMPSSPPLPDKDAKAPEGPAATAKPSGEASNASATPIPAPGVNGVPSSPAPAPLTTGPTASAPGNEPRTHGGGFEHSDAPKPAGQESANPTINQPNSPAPLASPSEAPSPQTVVPETPVGISAPPPADLRRPTPAETPPGPTTPALTSPGELTRGSQPVRLQPPLNQSPPSPPLAENRIPSPSEPAVGGMPPGTAFPSPPRDAATMAPAGLQIKPVSAVESYDEESHVCRANDTPESVSQEYYNTPRYARALVQFNRDHPKGSEGVKQEPPQLPAGQMLYIPPARVLQKNYANAIGESPSPAAIGNLAPPPMPGSAPQTPSAAGVRLYSIHQQNGEMLYQIAQRTLGTGDRWYEIALLNPQFKPEQPVPFGQQLKLPSDARIGASDAP